MNRHEPTMRNQALRSVSLAAPRRREVGGLGLLCLSAFLCIVGAPRTGAAEEKWQQVTVKDGVVVERRSVPGSSFHEHRARFSVKVSPDGLLDAIWSGINDQLPITVKQRKVIKQADGEMILYDQIKTPVVSDRDYTLRIYKVPHQDAQREVCFETVNHLGPPPEPHHVRIPMVRGRWLLSPAADGGSDVTYTVYSEPGGSIPAFVIRGAQVNQIIMDMKRIALRAQSRAAKHP